MSELNSASKPPPPYQVLPIIGRIILVYKVWHAYVKNFPKDFRYTLGGKIENFFIEIIECLFIASRLAREQKLPYLQKASLKLDLLKFFLQISWECKVLESKKYIEISEHLEQIGKQIGGWQKDVIRKINPA